jgi:hypothetical protein
MPQTVIYIDTQSMWVWFYTTSATLQPVGKIFSGLTRQKSISYGLNYKRTQLSDVGAAQIKGAYPAFEYALYTKGPPLGAVTINAADKKVMLRYAVPQVEIRAELERRGRRLAAKLLSALLPPGIAEKVMTSI